MAFFGFKSTKEVEEEKRKAAVHAAQQVVTDQQANLANLAKGSQFSNRVPYFDVFDSRLPEEGVPCAVAYTIDYAIEDVALYNSINKSQAVNDDVFKNKLRSTVAKYIKGCITNVPEDCQIPVVQLERKIMEISEYVRENAAPQIARVMGITVRNIDITAIELDKTSRGFRELRTYTSDMSKERMMAQHNMSMSDMRLQHETNQSNFKLQNSLNQSNLTLNNTLQQNQLKAQSSLNIEAMQRQQELSLGGQEELQSMQLENQRETMRIQREEMQRASKLQTEQTFLGAHQANLQSSLLNNAVNNGLGGVAAEQLGGGLLGGMGSTPQMSQQKTATPQVSYMLAVNNQQCGPFDWTQLQQLVNQGQLTQQTYVWTNGMPQWTFAGQVPELAPLFANVIPPMPGVPGMPPMPGQGGPTF